MNSTNPTPSQVDESIAYCKASAALIKAEACVKSEPGAELYFNYKLYQQAPTQQIAGRLVHLANRHMNIRIEDVAKFLESNTLLISQSLRHENTIDVARNVQQASLKLNGFACTANLIAAEQAIADFNAALAGR